MEGRLVDQVIVQVDAGINSGIDTPMPVKHAVIRLDAQRLKLVINDQLFLSLTYRDYTTYSEMVVPLP